MQSPKKSFKLDTTIIGAIIGAVATIVAAVIGGIFLLHSVASSPARTPTSTPSQTHLPTSSPDATVSTIVPPTSSSTPPPTSPPLRSFTCQSGTFCPFSIVITRVVIVGLGKSTWSFQITNNGTQAIDAYLQKVSTGDWRVYGGELHLKPNETQQIQVTFPSYAPQDGDSVEIALEFLIIPSLSKVDYSQLCTYSSSRGTCQ